MIFLTRSNGFLLLLIGIIAVTVQGSHSRPSPLPLPLPLTSNSNTGVIQSAKVSPLMRSIMKLRGGEDSDDESDEDEATDDESDDEEGDTSSSSIDYTVIFEKVTDVTNDKIIPVVGKVTAMTKDKIIPQVAKYSKKGAVTAKNVSISVYQALRRAISAALEGEEDEETDDVNDEDDDGEEGHATLIDKVLTISKKSIKVMKRMVKAALTVPKDVDDRDDVDEDNEAVSESEEEIEEETENNEGGESSENEDVESTTLESSLASDCGSYLAEAYGVDDKRKSGQVEEHTILGGSLQDALKIARQQARMLLVFIPSEKPPGEKGGFSIFGGNKKGDEESNENDKVAIESLLSSEVGKAANKKAKKNQGETNFGSFVIWAGKAGSSEAASAIKQLKIKEISKKGEKRPILCAVYPAVAAIGSNKIVPKVLAQHHCNPPMKENSMASWMNSLRKRHGKQYQSMQTDLKELELYQERKEGYMGSVQSDNERKKKEAEEEAERKAEEMKQAAHQAEIEARRQELQETLPEDVKKGKNVKKIALRFPDGRSGQRGFESDQPLTVVFDWVDAMFEIERETVVLTSLNGKQTFSWNDDETKSGKTLEDAGLKKMTAFRVSAA